MKRAASLMLRILLGGLFVWAGMSKLQSPLQTLASVYSYQIVLPDWLATGIALTLPWMEILVGLAVMCGAWMPIAMGWMAVLLIAFTALTTQAWWRELPIDCGCADFSSLHPALAVLTTTGGATLRNIVLLGFLALLAAIGCRRNEKPQAVDQPEYRGRSMKTLLPLMERQGSKPTHRKPTDSPPESDCGKEN